jgi:hypothetical protein
MEEMHMKMSKILTVLVFILVLMVFSNGAAAYPRIAVASFSSQNGNPEVGKDFVLSIDLSNMDKDCALDVATNIQVRSPFILQGISSVRTNSICQNQSTRINIPLKIDPSAVGGTYQITVTNTYESTVYAEYSSSDVINVFVQGSPDINAYITNSNPVDVYPGDTALLTVTLENDGTFQAQQVTANLTANSPLIVKWSNNFATIGVIDARQSKNVAFSIEVPKNAKIQDYPLHLEMMYFNEQRVQIVKDFSFIFHIKKKALFETTDDGSDGLFPNENGRVVRVMLKNTGSDVAKQIKVRMQPQFPFSTDGSVRYIETLNPGQSVPVNFVVNVDKDGTVGTYGLDMLLAYEDEQGKELQDTAIVSLNLQSKNIFRSVFLDYWFLWVLAIVIAIIIIRRRKPKKK